jgi:D-alanine-D-alanine ligase
LKICVLHRPYRNTEWQTKFSGQTFPDDAIEESRHHAAAIAANGHETEILTWSQDIRENVERLQAGNYDLVVNASSLEEVALLELLRIPFMGSGLNLVALDKATRKRLWQHAGVITPGFAHISHINQLQSAKLPPFPLFVKPVRGRGSAGITDESIVNSPEELLRACKRILDTMDQGALVEEYIQGTEVTVGVIGNGEQATVLPPLEVEYGAGAKTNSFLHKQDREVLHCPARLPQSALEQLQQAAKAAFISLEARDFGRIDFIYDHNRQQPYALELNTFAGLQILTGEEAHLHQSYIGKMAMEMGWSSQQLFKRLLDSCLERINNQ